MPSCRALPLLALLIATPWHSPVNAAEQVEPKDKSAAESVPPGQRKSTLRASRTFRAAVPDLACEERKVVMAGRFVTVHMHVTSHISGRFGALQGHGAPVAFTATDLLKIDGGRILINWHIEDKFTLFQQMGVSP